MDSGLIPDGVVPFQKANLVVPVEPTPWPVGKDERASVNNFDLGGTNVHVSSCFRMLWSRILYAPGDYGVNGFSAATR